MAILIPILSFKFEACDFEGDADFAVLATPHMLSLLKYAQFVEIDVTFPGNKAFPYLLNMVTFNYHVMKFQVVARILMSKLSTAAYKIAIMKVLRLTNNFHPEFCFGVHVKGWQLDFNIAQRDGLAANLGQKSSEVIRGCEVHFKRNVKKVADKVNSDELSMTVFTKIALSIPNLISKRETSLAFDLLCGKISSEDHHLFLKANQFLLITVKHSQDDLLSVNTSQWSKAGNWVKWWSQTKIAKMYTKSFNDMSDEDWEICPKTTNAVEAHNKLSNESGSKLLIVLLEDMYRQDKKACFKSVCASYGVTTGVSKEKRATITKRKRRNRLHPRVKLNDKTGDKTNDKTDDKTDDEKSDDDKGNGNAGKRKNEEGARKSKRLRTNNSDDETDAYIGKNVWVLTKTKQGTKTTNHGWCEGTIERKNKKGEYISKYTHWKNYCAVIPDVKAKTVKFTDTN